MVVDTGRIAWLDFAKGFVMLTVIFGHAGVYNNEKFFVDALIVVYEFHMPFFFVTAGFLLNLKKWSGAEIFTLAVVALSYLGYVTGKIVSLPMSLDIALTAQIFLLTGVLIRKYKIVERLNLRQYLILTCVFVLIFFLNEKISMVNREYGNWFLLNIGGIAGTLLVMKISANISRLGGKFCELMNYCGRQSLFVLTAHLIIAFVVYDFVVNFTGMELTLVRSLPEIIFAITLLGFLIPLLIAKRFGRLPVLKYFCV